MQEENKVMTKAIPSGFSSFEEIRTNDYYYVDKTMMIKELLYPRPNKVSLITRPRRFGKTLNRVCWNASLTLSERAMG